MKKMIAGAMIAMSCGLLFGCTKQTTVTETTTAGAAETTAAETAAAETTAAETEIAKAEYETYESKDGWKLSYLSSEIKMEEGSEGTMFSYTGECDGVHQFIISYAPGKQPEEVLWEKTERYNPQDIQSSEGYFAGQDNWSFHAEIKPEAPKADMYEGYTAVEHNDGVLLISMLSKIEADEGRAMHISDVMAEALDTFEFTDHEPQKEYAYVPGLYVRVYEEEFDGTMQTLSDSYELLEDHTGTFTAQDSVPVYWTSKEIVEENSDSRYEYTIEGDTLLVNMDDNWISYEKNPDGKIKPLPGAYTMENLSDCMPFAEFSAEDFDWDLNCLYALIYDIDNYDMVDVAQLKVGDVIETANGDVTIRTLKETNYGKLINEDEEDQLVLQPLEEGSGVFQIVAEDDVCLKRLLGQAQLTLAENVILHDCTDQPGETIDVKADELKDYLDQLPEERKQFSPDATTITIENDIVTEITRNWRP